MLLYNAHARRTRDTTRRKNRRETAEESLEKYAGPWVTVINHPRSYSGDLFRFLLAKRRSSGYSRQADGRGKLPGVKVWHRFHRADDKMQFFTRNKTLQDSGDVMGNPTWLTWANRLAVGRKIAARSPRRRISVSLEKVNCGPCSLALSIIKVPY